MTSQVATSQFFNITTNANAKLIDFNASLMAMTSYEHFRIHVKMVLRLEKPLCDEDKKWKERG